MKKPAKRLTLSAQYLQNAATEVSKYLPDNHGFILLTSPYGPPPNRIRYVSTLERESAISVLKQFLTKATGSGEWLKHV
jgi:hypothetical protein